MYRNKRENRTVEPVLKDCHLLSITFIMFILGKTGGVDSEFVIINISLP